MNPLSGPTDIVNPGHVKLVARLMWSQRRAWHGDTVKMQLRTELVKDDTDVELRVLSSTDTEIDKIGGKKVTGAVLDNDYDIKWKDKPYAAQREFKLAAKVGDQLQAEQSPMLYVDLDDPVFSA